MLKIEDLSDGVRVIGLDRAEKRNAIGVELTLALEQVRRGIKPGRAQAARRRPFFHLVRAVTELGYESRDTLLSSPDAGPGEPSAIRSIPGTYCKEGVPPRSRLHGASILQGKTSSAERSYHGLNHS